MKDDEKEFLLKEIRYCFENSIELKKWRDRNLELSIKLGYDLNKLQLNLINKMGEQLNPVEKNFTEILVKSLQESYIQYSHLVKVPYIKKSPILDAGFVINESDNKAVKNRQEIPAPPEILLTLAQLLISPKQQEWLLGDICEKYEKTCKNSGRNEANKRLLENLLKSACWFVWESCYSKLIKAIEYMGLSKFFNKIMN